jgi:hypothetical protein
MRMLICGDCPDSLTTVAQSLNRIHAEQMRTELSPPAAAPLPRPEAESSVDRERFAPLA